MMTLGESKSEAGLEKEKRTGKPSGQQERTGLANLCKEYLRNILESLRESLFVLLKRLEMIYWGVGSPSVPR